jgi:hypothetical protein
MTLIDVASLVVGAVAGFWMARRPRSSGKLALAIGLLPFAGFVMAFVF